MNGIVNERLVPTVPLNIKKKDGEWQEISLLLDTGFNGEIVLDPALLDGYNLATRPDHQSRTPEEVLENGDNWNPKAPYKGEIEWGGREKEAGVRLVPEHPLNGMLGTELLKYQRLTVDVLEGRSATIESIPPRSSSAIIRWRSLRSKRQTPFEDDLEEYVKWWGSYLPWTKIQVQDSEGKFRPMWVNVDTGDSGKLSLPAYKVDLLGLKASGKIWIHTTNGREEANQGEIKIIWRGKRRLVKCTHRPNDTPPLIGMKLLKGTRITVDFDVPMPIAEIRRIPGPVRSVRGFMNYLGNFFRY